MRKYIIAFLAIVLAIGAAAFTKPHHATDQFVFQYSGDFTQGSVETLSNWSYVGTNVSLCNNFDQRACRVAVIADYVDNPDLPTALDNVTISASSTNGTEFVTAISGTGNEFSNKND